jgi:hypothetical protein
LASAIANAATNEVICLTAGNTYTGPFDTSTNTAGNSGVQITAVASGGATKATITTSTSGYGTIVVASTTDGWTFGPNLIVQNSFQTTGNDTANIYIIGANDTRVTGDELKGSCGSGVTSDGGQGTRVDHSFIHDNSYHTGCSAPSIRSNGVSVLTTSDSNVNNNVIRNNGTLTNGQSQWGSGYGVYVSGTSSGKVIYNTLYDNGYPDHVAESGAVGYFNSSNGVIVNNIASNSASWNTEPATCNGSSSYTMTDNIWFNYQDPLSTACTAGTDNDETHDPLFVGTTGDIFRLGSGSPGYDTGSDTYTGYTDYEGITRPQSLCGALCTKHEDKGAFERH